MKPRWMVGVLACMLSVAWAGELAGVKMPEEKVVAKRQLVLNGMGLRKATFLKVNVYVGGLYLAAKSKDPNQILASSDPKSIDMVFVRDVSGDKIKDAWRDSYKENCGSVCDRFKPQLERLVSLMRDVKNGDKMTFDFLPEAVEVSVGNLPPVPVEGGPEFTKIILSSWLGSHPPNWELKDGMLGACPGRFCK